MRIVSILLLLIGALYNVSSEAVDKNGAQVRAIWKRTRTSTLMPDSTTAKGSLLDTILTAEGKENSKDEPSSPKDKPSQPEKPLIIRPIVKPPKPTTIKTTKKPSPFINILTIAKPAVQEVIGGVAEASSAPEAAPEAVLPIINKSTRRRTTVKPKPKPKPKPAVAAALQQQQQRPVVPSKPLSPLGAFLLGGLNWPGLNVNNGGKQADAPPPPGEPSAPMSLTKLQQLVAALAGGASS